LPSWPSSVQIGEQGRFTVPIVSRALLCRPAIFSKLEESRLCGVSGFALLASHLQQIAPQNALPVDLY